MIIQLQVKMRSFTITQLKIMQTCSIVNKNILDNTSKIPFLLLLFDVVHGNKRNK